METRRSVKEAKEYYDIPSGVASEKDFKDESLHISHTLSTYFGVFTKHYKDISDGLKAVRTSLFDSGPEYVFELETLGSIESARIEYDWRMQVEIIFFWDHRWKHRILCHGNSNEALLMSGPLGSITIEPGRDDRTFEAIDEAELKVKARLKVEAKDKVLKIHVPKEIMPGRDRLENPGKWFGWFMNVGLAVPPLDPIPTNLPDVYWVPEICSIWCPKDQAPSTYSPMWKICLPDEVDTPATPPAGE